MKRRNRRNGWQCHPQAWHTEKRCHPTLDVQKTKCALCLTCKKPKMRIRSGRTHSTGPVGITQCESDSQSKAWFGVQKTKRHLTFGVQKPTIDRHSRYRCWQRRYAVAWSAIWSTNSCQRHPCAWNVTKQRTLSLMLGVQKTECYLRLVYKKPNVTLRLTYKKPNKDISLWL